ncbi:hypothetical protein SKAU_G00015000 [Synaphobranchus kaupii]|uniref:Uncharacterized protein n=1 Tax=Synaphobranchus kaupii TaxID=118154 RepID=A0A9Q1GB20_SYNKA|nr:hypothetical protein SKAU_G00015000 [Synaphobranchus kaupii]
MLTEAAQLKQGRKSGSLSADRCGNTSVFLSAVGATSRAREWLVPRPQRHPHTLSDCPPGESAPVPGFGSECASFHPAPCDKTGSFFRHLHIPYSAEAIASSIGIGIGSALRTPAN